MRFRILRASSSSLRPMQPIEGAVQGEDGNWFIEIDTLEELIALQQRAGDNLIVNSEQIWIYDGYME